MALYKDKKYTLYITCNFTQRRDFFSIFFMKYQYSLNIKQFNHSLESREPWSSKSLSHPQAFPEQFLPYLS